MKSKCIILPVAVVTGATVTLLVSPLVVHGQTTTAPDFTLTISRPSSTNVAVSWPTTPGLTYDLLVAPTPGAPFTTVNSQPIQAQTTILTYADTNEAPARFYRVAQRPLPPTNNSSGW